MMMRVTSKMGYSYLRPLKCLLPVRCLHAKVPTRPHVEVGTQASETRRITEEEMKIFGHISKDYNPVHYVGIELKDGTKVSLVHGALLNALVSAVIGTKLPGPGTIVASQTLRFPQPCFVGEEITTTVQVMSVRKIVEVCFQCVVDVKSATPKIVLDGEAKLILPRGSVDTSP